MSVLSNRAGRYLFVIESSLALPADPSSVSRARRFVRNLLVDWDVEELEEPATLLTSELVTNAVLHARTGPEVTVRLSDGSLWIGVSDGVSITPMRKRYGPEAATGRGLLLVERMATAWGTEASGTGKIVWFELARGEAPSTSIELDAEALADLADLADLAAPAPSSGTSSRDRRDLRGPRARRRRRQASLNHRRRTGR